MAKGDLSVDSDLVRALAALLEETGLTEIEYARGDQRIRVARSLPSSAAASIAAGAVPARLPEAAAPPALEKGAVKSPMVGTAYLSPQPGVPPFVTAGAEVREGQVLLLIEAMKVMNQILAPHAGRIREIRVADGAPVEYGQVLMLLE